MREYINTRNPILPLKYHVPDCEGHVMPDGKLYILAALMTGRMFFAVIDIMWFPHQI